MFAVNTYRVGERGVHMLAVSGPVVLWLMFGTWVIHDAEELLVGPRWFDRHEADLQGRAEDSPTKRFLDAIEGDPTALAVAIGIIGVFVLVATVLGFLDPDGVGMLVYVTILGGYTVGLAIVNPTALLAHRIGRRVSSARESTVPGNI